MNENISNVFGLMRRNRDGQEEIVIVKSKARKHCVDIDGMSHEEFEEHWDYNIAGSLGLSEYCTIDDEIDAYILGEIISEEGHGIIDPRGDNSEFDSEL